MIRNLQQLDLNPLLVLAALMQDQHLSRAALRLHRSQPAVSNALHRLRDLLDDPLLVRVGRTMQPTPRALELEAPIRAALRQIEESLGEGSRFEPARSRQRFRIALTDYAEMLTEARQIATGRMVKNAEELGADAVVGMRYASASVMQGAAEVIAYGTAVKFV